MVTDYASKVKDAVEAISTERVVALTRALCSVPFGPAAEGPRAEIIADALYKLPIDVHVADVVAGRPNVIATLKGRSDRPPLVLQGHIDAGYYPTGWTHDPRSPWEESARLFGGGVSDMLGAVAAMVAALEAAPQLGSLPGDLILHATMHHDGTGLGSKYALLTEGPDVGFAICGEPSDLSIHTANGGAFKFEVRLDGTPAHISRMEQAVDTLQPATAVCEAIREHMFDHHAEPRLPDLPRLIIGELHAGRAPATVADSATIRGDIRTVPGMTRQSFMSELEQIVAGVVPESVAWRVRIIGMHQPFLGAVDGPLVTALSAAHTQVRGGPPVIGSSLPGQAFVTDAADLAAVGLDTVVYGVGDWHAGPDESVSITELADSARIYLATAAILGGS